MTVFTKLSSPSQLNVQRSPRLYRVNKCQTIWLLSGWHSYSRTSDWLAASLNAASKKPKKTHRDYFSLSTRHNQFLSLHWNTFYNQHRKKKILYSACQTSYEITCNCCYHIIPSSIAQLLRSCQFCVHLRVWHEKITFGLVASGYHWNFKTILQVSLVSSSKASLIRLWNIMEKFWKSEIHVLKKTKKTKCSLIQW